jgi:hypothetical protein
MFRFVTCAFFFAFFGSIAWLAEHFWPPEHFGLGGNTGTFVFDLVVVALVGGVIVGVVSLIYLAGQWWYGRW